MRLINRNWGHVFLYLHIITLSWSAVARLGDWAPLPLVFLGLALISTLIGNFFEINFDKNVLVKIYKIDFVIIIAFFLLCLNVLYNPTPKGGNYILAYGVVFGLYLIYSALGISKINAEEILKYNYYAISFICLFVILEVVGKSALGFDIFEWIPRTKEATANFSIGYRRAYGLSTEPTQLANYFACFSPYAIWYRLNIKGKQIGVYSVFLIIAAFLTVSTALVVVILSATLFTLIITNQKLKTIKTIGITLIALMSFFLLLAYYLGIGDVLFDAFGKVSDKLSILNVTGTGNVRDVYGTSVNQRLQSINSGLSMIMSYPFTGVGLGYLSSLGKDSSINWYIFLGAEAGIIILFLFVFWFIFHFISAILNYKQQGNDIFLFAAISIYCGLAYFMFISTFQNLFLLTSILLYRVILNNLIDLKGR